MNTSTIDFLGVGAQKAGTTWLWSILKSHPDVWMPPKKELHYFDRDRKYPSWSYLAEKKLINRLIGKETYHQEFRRLLKEDLSRAIRSGSWRQIRWMTRFYFGTYGDSWYLSLFADGGHLLKGEITPDYSLIDLDDIRSIKTLLPELKIILMLRNPVDRAWSQVRFEYTKGRFSHLNEAAKIKHILDQPKVSRRGDYVRMINDWTAVFGKDAVFIGFYDEIVSDPQRLLQKVCAFLNLDALKLPPKNLAERKNVSVEKSIPTEIEFLLAEKYEGEIKELLTILDSDYIAAWLGKTESILARAAQVNP
ncbi:sulfotransferase family protein [Nodosilinea nodulosa]|uniref:sulfotransferase family protein n=1 Tax=Nodosilinea nodulosa TaxID=416001 RepID=UPI000310CBE0|nr:sulfotransferase [Nodosilinea nodulosa]